MDNCNLCPLQTNEISSEIFLLLKFIFIFYSTKVPPHVRSLTPGNSTPGGGGGGLPYGTDGDDRRKF